MDENEIKLYQHGRVLLTKTRQYLNPVLKLYGKDFLNEIKKLYTVRSGIGDMILEVKLKKEYRQHLFLLINVDKTDPDVFQDVLDYLRDHSSYESDYPFDDIKEGNLHMIVVRVPKDTTNAVEQFRQSKYSKMYSPALIDKLFQKTASVSDVTYSVLKKDDQYRFIFESMINRRSKIQDENTRIILPEDAELDYLIEIDKEIFRIDG